MNAAEAALEVSLGGVKSPGLAEVGRSKYMSPGRRGLRRLLLEGAKWSHEVRAVDAEHLTRTYRRVVAALIRGKQLPTDPEQLARTPQALELARHLGDIGRMLPLATEILKYAIELSALHPKQIALIRSVTGAKPYSVVDGNGRRRTKAERRGVQVMRKAKRRARRAERRGEVQS